MTETDFSPSGLSKMLQDRLGDLAGHLGAEGGPTAPKAIAADAGEFAALFGSPLGQKVLTQLAAMTILSPTWDPNQGAEHGYYREGQNSVVQHIIDQMHAGQRAHEGVAA